MTMPAPKVPDFWDLVVIVVLTVVITLVAIQVNFIPVEWDIPFAGVIAFFLGSVVDAS